MLPAKSKHREQAAKRQRSYIVIALVLEYKVSLNFGYLAQEIISPINYQLL